jgi:hypothetical protein
MYEDAKTGREIIFLITVTFFAWSRGSIPIRDSGSEPGIIAGLRAILRALAG